MGLVIVVFILGGTIPAGFIWALIWRSTGIIGGFVALLLVLITATSLLISSPFIELSSDLTTKELLGWIVPLVGVELVGCLIGGFIFLICQAVFEALRSLNEESDD